MLFSCLFFLAQMTPTQTNYSTENYGEEGLLFFCEIICKVMLKSSRVILFAY